MRHILINWLKASPDCSIQTTPLLQGIVHEPFLKQDVKKPFVTKAKSHSPLLNAQRNQILVGFQVFMHCGNMWFWGKVIMMSFFLLFFVSTSRGELKLPFSCCTKMGKQTFQQSEILFVSGKPFVILNLCLFLNSKYGCYTVQTVLFSPAAIFITAIIF